MENIEKIDLNILNETIEYLKNNDESCKLSNMETEEANVITIPESLPSEKLIRFMEYIEEIDLYDKNYFENSKNILPDSEIKRFSFENCLTRFTYAVRADRFSSGSLYSDVKSGLILKLLLRIRELKTGIKEGYESMDYIEKMIEDVKNMDYDEKFTLNQLFRKYNLIDTTLDYKLDIMERLFDELKEKNIIVKYLANESHQTDSFDIDCIKVKSKSLILKIDHTPFHGCFGLKEEVEKNIPETITTFHELKENEIVHYGRIYLEIKKIDNDYIETILDYASTFFINGSKNFNVDKLNLQLSLNNPINITLDICDAMETWILTLIEKDV